MMLDKVDRSSVATDLATSCQGRIGFCRFRKPFNLVSLKMKVLLLATLLSADKLKGRGQERPLDFLAIFKVLKNS